MKSYNSVLKQFNKKNNYECFNLKILFRIKTNIKDNNKKQQINNVLFWPFSNCQFDIFPQQVHRRRYMYIIKRIMIKHLEKNHCKNEMMKKNKKNIKKTHKQSIYSHNSTKNKLVGKWKYSKVEAHLERKIKTDNQCVCTRRSWNHLIRL